MNIQLSDSISKEEYEHLFRWKEQVFPIEGKSFKWVQPEWHLYAREEGELASAHLGYSAFELSLDGIEISVVGVGDVVVRPEFQGKGLPSKLFNHLHTSDHANSLADVFSLFCPHRLVPYYEKHGYKAFEGTFSFLQKGQETTTDKFALMFRGQSLIGTDIKIFGNPW